MAGIFLVVPTAGRDTLAPLVDSCGLPRDHVVIVSTRPGTVTPDGCRVLEDFGPVNIQRWWNRGIALAESYGARYAAVLNDDVEIDATTIPALVEALDGPVLASPGGPSRSTNPNKEIRLTIDGACWALDLSVPLRLDEKYRWWFGDNDLDWRARRDFGGTVRVPVPYRHVHPNDLTSMSPELQRLADMDARTWMQS